MSSNKAFKDRRTEKTISAVLGEKRSLHRYHEILARLKRDHHNRIKDIERESAQLEDEMSTYRQGMTNVESYYTKEVTKVDDNIIIFPFRRSLSELRPQVCATLTPGGKHHQCNLFPCKKLTSYNFMFRELPEFILKRAHEHSQVLNSGQPVPSSENEARADSARLLPWFPPNMTEKERKLKICIERKRRMNRDKNKPKDRNINYGKPTPVRQLQKPLRPNVRRIDTK